MLYATRFFAPDPFIFLEQNGKRTLVLSDLEIDRGRKQAQADEILPYSEFEKEVQGKSAKAPAYEKVLAHFLAKKKVRSALVPAKFPLGFARELEANKIRVEPAGELFWPDRETKTEAELRLMRKALEITEAGMARGIEVLKKSKPGKGGKLEWSGNVLTSEILRAEIDSAVLRAGGFRPTRSWPGAIRPAIRMNAGMARSRRIASLSSISFRAPPRAATTAT